jgi:hypothetical protein
MSLKVMNWAWTIPLPPTPKLVLMALADEADDTGFCFPSQGRLARKCSISDRNVRRMIVLLVALGLMLVEERFNRNRGRTSNGYRLLCDAPRTNGPRAADAADPADRSELSGGIGQPCPEALDNAVQVTTTDSCSYPRTLPPHANRVAGATPAVAEKAFHDGGQLDYPKALSRPQQRALQLQLAHLSFEQAQQVLDELTGRMEATNVRDPVRYCAGIVRRLQAGQFTPELGLSIAKRRQSLERRELQQDADRRLLERPLNNRVAGLPDELRQRLERMRTTAGQCATDGGPSSSPALGHRVDDGSTRGR